jgi:SAM-dependent methyltransferase
LEAEMLALLGKTINMMEGFSFLWVVDSGLELDLWRLLADKKTLDDILRLRPNWDPMLLDHWLEQALCLDLLSKSNGRYQTTKLGRAVETYRDQGLAAMFKEFNLYWSPYFATLPQLITQKEAKKTLNVEMENELISKASLASEPFVWPLLKDKCKSSKWKRVLDIGCGEGGYLFKLLTAFPELQGVGIEMNQKVASRANEQVKNFQDRLEIICMDAFELNHSLGKFDVCLLNNVIYYFNQEQRLRLLSLVKERLTKGGQVGILCALRGSDYALRMFRTHIPQNLMSFFLACHQGFQGLPTADEVKTMFKELGYAKIEVKPLMFNTSYYFFATN